MALFKIEKFSFCYPEETKESLKEIETEIEEGDFVVVCGRSGCGKTTLLRHLKPLLAPHGSKQGNIYFKGKLIDQMDLRSQAMKLGYVLQNPEQQIVTDKVWHELAFGLENLGYSSEVIRLRVAEMANFFGIQNWFMKSVKELSGGQKQLLNLAAVMAMQPEVLILDEPTAQLDPIAAKNLLEMVKRINNELGITIIISEHRLEEVLPMSNKVIVMEEGHVLVQGNVQEIGRYIGGKGHDLSKTMPTPMQIAYAVGVQDEVYPVTVKEGRVWLKQLVDEKGVKNKVHEDIINSYRKQVKHSYRKQEENALKLKDIYFRYEKEKEEILKGFSCNVKRGSLYAMLGGNGTGKTTALSIMAGLYKPYRGKVYINKGEKVIMLPQNPQDLFECQSVNEELAEMVEGLSAKKNNEQLMEEVIRRLGIEALLKKHPYDLSGGEMQCVALAKLLLLKPTILLLDEPTKGMDACFKEKIGKIFNELKEAGITLIMVSHDLAFCAQYADECALMFDGQIISSGAPHIFFMENNFYTTATNRMSRGIIEGCILPQEVICSCKRLDKAEDQDI